jgi:hypothetical protein
MRPFVACRQALGGPRRRELIAEKTHETLIKAIIDIRIARFGSKAEAIETELKAIDDDTRLQELIKHAATCPTLSSFRKRVKS